MTPGLLWDLERQHMNDVEMAALPVDKLSWLYANSNRDPGEQDKDGRWVRQPAPVLDLDEFRTYGRKLKALAAKDRDSWDPSLQGARADKGAFQAWAGATAHEIFVPTEEN